MNQVPPNIQELVGVQWTAGGRSVEAGFDCLTIVQEALRRRFGQTFELPADYHPERVGLEVISTIAFDFEEVEVPEAAAGDLVDMRVDGEDHVAFLATDFWLLETRRGTGAVLTPWGRRKAATLGVYRFKAEGAR